MHIRNVAVCCEFSLQEVSLIDLVHPWLDLDNSFCLCQRQQLSEPERHWIQLLVCRSLWMSGYRLALEEIAERMLRFQ